MDDYEFHYAGELNHDNLDEVRDALDVSGIATIRTGLHTDSRFGRGGLHAPDAATRAEARIDSVAAKIDDVALREAQSRKDAVRADELVDAALGA